MAKTKKQTRARRTTRLLAWLNPTTPAKKILLFISIFVLIGTGFYAYRALAATYVIARVHHQMLDSSGVYSICDPGNPPSKKCSMVKHMDFFGTFTVTNFPWKSGKYRFCVFQRRPPFAYGRTMIWVVASNGSTIYEDGIGVYGTDKYERHCFKWIERPSGISMDVWIYNKEGEFSNPQYQWMRIGWIDMEYECRC